MAPLVELAVDARDYRGFAMILYGVLDLLGVPTERIMCVCRGKAGPDILLQGHVIVHLWVPASAYVPVLHAFEEVAMETSVAACVQSVSRTALYSVMRNAHDYLQTGPYRLLPCALNLNQVTVPQDATADYTTRVEVDPCLSISAQYILAQDNYIMEVESQNHSLRDF
jgi:hypothetical protein